MYRHVLESSKTNKVIVVVSAMGRYPDAYATDTLLSMGSEFSHQAGKSQTGFYGRAAICTEDMQ